MKENSIQNNNTNNTNEKINAINNINSKIGKILENNLISNLIIIFIGFITALFITGSVLIFMNRTIYFFDSESLLSLFTPFFHLFYFFSLSLIFYINKNFNLKNIFITFLSIVFIFIVDLSSGFFIRSVLDNSDFFMQIYILSY